MSSCNIDVYECSDKGLILPIVNEYSWAKGTRAFVYIVGLIYCFLGVSIIADIFMRSIEMITSKTSMVRIADNSVKHGYREVQVKVWNSTVANLTLMALGSSAPEILLSCIEIAGNGFKAGDLGPGTIVGSAAFNLLVITAVCVISIPSGETRIIKSIKVFAVTAIFSVFAYLWLLIVLVVITPDFVDLWEAVITFLFFPLLVVIAYMTDKDYLRKKTEPDEGGDIGELGMDEDNIKESDKASADIIASMMRKIGKRPDVSEGDEAKIAAAMLADNMQHDRGWYRINAIRELSGGTKLKPTVNEHQAEILKYLKEGEEMGSTASILSASDSVTMVQWTTTASAVIEKDGVVTLILMRSGNMDKRVLVRVETIDGTAEAESDYIPYKETLVFEPGEKSKSIDIKIVDDNEWEPDEVFFAKVSVVDDDDYVIVGKRAINQITILNDDTAGTFEFVEPSVVVKESVGTVQIPVSRVDGADGRVAVNWEATNQTAVYGKDYDTNKGTVVFEHGELTKNIEIGIIDDQEFEKDEHFEVTLVSCDCDGAKLGKLQRTIVTILNDDDFKGMVSRVVNMTNTNLDMLQLHKATWSQQFQEAMNVNGGEVESATAKDYILHFLTFGWKVIFAMVPPPNIWGGWLTFFVSLGLIGILTTFINDLASIFGCLVNLKDSITAITLVALGTSLPDLFASRQAAVQEKYADNSIGNVTGSNSVNVFMGLGISWTLAAIYWGAQGKTFEVPAGSLAFSVVLYCVCAIVAISFLIFRRYIPFLGKGELGGPTGVKWFTFFLFIFLWFFYVIMSILQAYEIMTVNL